VLRLCRLYRVSRLFPLVFFFFFNDTATTEIYTLSLHDALPICHGPDEVRLVEAMRSLRFDFGGSQPHSYWEMYVGYGLFAAVNCLIEALLFWWASRHTTDARGLVNAVIAIFLFANITYGALVWRYFFFIPLVMDTLVALCLAAAFLAGRTAQSAIAHA